MSRLIVKNLPSYVDPARLRTHFTSSNGPGGTLTDVKVALKPDGTSRRFGFIGYKTEKEALQAREWYDRTFLDSTRISVSVIEGAKDAPSPRPNKRPRLGPSPTDNEPANGPSTASTSKPAHNTASKSDKTLSEFMDVMQPRSKKGPTWANEVTVPQPVVPAPDADVDMEQGKESGKKKEEEGKEGLSDAEWMRRHMSKRVDEVEKVFEQSDDEDAGVEVKVAEEEEAKLPTPAEPEPPQDPTKQTILQTSRLFVRNLAFSCTESDLTDLFSRYGALSQVHIPLDLATKQSKGLAYITFAQAVHALEAYEALDRKSFQGRLLHILAAVDRRGNLKVEEEGADGRKKTVKDEKNAKRKAMAGKEFNWSMLYMNADAVASSIADRMSISKSDILNPDADSNESSTNPAVKLALAETHIIHETKSYLESQGVLLSAFSSKARSDTAILVKNIPYGTTEEQIRELFEPHGALNRVLVPPAGTMAVVDFERGDEAVKAFKAVAYRRLGNSVVYLEKGPLGIFDGTIREPTYARVGEAPVSSTAAVTVSDQDTHAAQDEEGSPSVTGGSTLYVKNLAFSTTQEKLMQVFQHLPSFSFARIQTKPDPKRPGAKLSMGYGFVGFKDTEGAKKALKSMHGFNLDGHALSVKFAGRGAEEETKGKDGAAGKKGTTTKMIVKNVPFEATKKDIRDLFGMHGQLKSVRLPKKFDSRTRGFAFLDFVSRHEAENAYAALRHTHLLGRHLVLEWAEEAEQDLEVLRQKAGVGYGAGKAMPGRKRKLDMGKTGEEDVEDLEG